jgi:hypothetical protein
MNDVCGVANAAVHFRESGIQETKIVYIEEYTTTEI